jgi:Protein of unknown function (DUF3551)
VDARPEIFATAPVSERLKPHPSRHGAAGFALSRDVLPRPFALGCDNHHILVDTFWWIVGVSIQFATKGHSAVRMRIASVVLSVRFPFCLLRHNRGRDAVALALQQPFTGFPGGVSRPPDVPCILDRKVKPIRIFEALYPSFAGYNGGLPPSVPLARDGNTLNLENHRNLKIPCCHVYSRRQLFANAIIAASRAGVSRVSGCGRFPCAAKTANSVWNKVASVAVLFAEEVTMRTIIVFLLALVGMSYTSTDADAGAWCANYRRGVSNCGYSSHAQCWATVQGLAGYCAPNPFPGTAYGTSSGSWNTPDSPRRYRRSY